MAVRSGDKLWVNRDVMCSRRTIIVITLIAYDSVPDAIVVNLATICRIDAASTIFYDDVVVNL